MLVTAGRQPERWLLRERIGCVLTAARGAHLPGWLAYPLIVCCAPDAAQPR